MRLDGRGEVPPGHPDQQDTCGGEEHQRETFDQRVGAIDERVFEVGELGSVEQEVGTGHRREEDHGWLNDRREDAGLPYRQDSQHAAECIQRAEDAAEFIVAGVERDPDCRDAHGDQDGAPPRHARKARIGGTTIDGNRRRSPLI